MTTNSVLQSLSFRPLQEGASRTLYFWDSFACELNEMFLTAMTNRNFGFRTAPIGQPCLTVTLSKFLFKCFKVVYEKLLICQEKLVYEAAWRSRRRRWISDPQRALVCFSARLSYRFVARCVTTLRAHREPCESKGRESIRDEERRTEHKDPPQLSYKSKREALRHGWCAISCALRRIVSSRVATSTVARILDKCERPGDISALCRGPSLGARGALAQTAALSRESKPTIREHSITKGGTERIPILRDLWSALRTAMLSESDREKSCLEPIGGRPCPDRSGAGGQTRIAPRDGLRAAIQHLELDADCQLNAPKPILHSAEAGALGILLRGASTPVE